MGVYGTWVSRRLLAQVNSRLIEICNSRFLMLSLVKNLKIQFSSFENFPFSHCFGNLIAILSRVICKLLFLGFEDLGILYSDMELRADLIRCGDQGLVWFASFRQFRTSCFYCRLLMFSSFVGN